MFRYVFGPVASRRLGKSLGLNNIPYKTCTYSCVYCQLGKTVYQTVSRKAFYKPGEVVEDVLKFLTDITKDVDYVSFVPSGEPTLDINLGLEIEEIKRFKNIKIAVFTNSSLLFLDNVREDLMKADLVSIKIDCVREDTWRKLNRPHYELKLGEVLNGVKIFAKEFKGILLTETMVVEGINTNVDEAEDTVRFIKELNPLKAYLSIPVRPPAEPYAKPPPKEELQDIYLIFTKILGRDRVELLDKLEPNIFKIYGNPEEWLLNTVAVHPLKLDYALEILRNSVEDPQMFLDNLVKKGLIKIVLFLDTKFIVRTSNI